MPEPEKLSEDKEKGLTIFVVGIIKDFKTYTKHIIALAITGLLGIIGMGLWKYTVSFVDVPDEVIELRVAHTHDSLQNIHTVHLTDSLKAVVGKQNKWIYTLWMEMDSIKHSKKHH